MARCFGHTLADLFMIAAWGRSSFWADLAKKECPIAHTESPIRCIAALMRGHSEK